MKRKKSILLVSIGLISTLAAAMFQERPGRGDWLHSLAGDWSIELCNEYTIEPSLELSDGNYEAMRWVKTGEGYSLRHVADGIKTYRVYGDEVLLRSANEWIHINTLTGEKRKYDPNSAYRFEGHEQYMKVPGQSIRDRLILVSCILGGILLYLVLKTIMEGRH